jgi:hypothetical protein
MTVFQSNLKDRASQVPAKQLPGTWTTVLNIRKQGQERAWSAWHPPSVMGSQQVPSFLFALPESAVMGRGI